MWLAVAIIATVLGVSAIASASQTFRRSPPEEVPEVWKGKGPPPERMRPRPRFAAGDEVSDTATGKPRRHTIDELAGYKSKRGVWEWRYTMTDGTIASEETLRKAE